MKQKRNKGFTMAEMLAVVALILILAAVAAVAVYRYRRSMRQLEYDAIAKEIFIVAQNHLTMADNQGLLGERTAIPERKTERKRTSGILSIPIPTRTIQTIPMRSA